MRYLIVLCLFQGTERTSEITGKPELYYPEAKRTLFRYFVSAPTIAFCLGVVFAVVWIILEIQQWWDGIIKEQEYPKFLR